MSALSLSDYQDQIITSNCATLDYIPLISNISGAVRVLFGSIQTTVGLILFPVELLSRVSDYQNSFIAVQGIANVVRGLIAYKPIIGNAVLYIYDHNPHMKYGFQKTVGIIY